MEIGLFKGLVTNNGEGGRATKREGGGGQVKFYPCKEGGGGLWKSLSHAERGRGTTSFEVVLTRELEVLAIVMGGGVRKKCPPFKRGGGHKVLPCLRGGRTKFRTCDFPIL